MIIAGSTADCGQVLGLTKIKTEAISQQLAGPESVRDILQGLLKGCPGRGPLARCPILNVLEEHARESKSILL